MKKQWLALGMILWVAMIAVTGCGSGSHGEVIPDPDPWPAATTEWQDSGMQALSVPEASGNIAGAFKAIETKSDGSNLYVKVIFDRVGVGHNVWLLVDDKSMGSDYNSSRWDSNFTIMWGSMGMTIASFDLDFIYLRARSWDDANKGQWVMDSWAKIAHAVIGPNEDSIRNVTDNCSDIETTGSLTPYSSYEITIPYSSIGSGAHSGDRVQIVALLGRETWKGDNEGTYITNEEGSPIRPLGIQSAIPGNETSVLVDNNASPVVYRIKEIKKAVRCTLK